MTYFLDFDRTLFDTAAFLAYVIERERLQSIQSLPIDEQGLFLARLAEAGKLSFAPGDLSRFLFPDAKNFLDAHEAECVVVTFGGRALQENKLESAFHGRTALRYFCTGLERKGPYIARLLAENPAPWLFADDKPIELDSVREHAPGVSLYEICRGDAPGSGAYPIIRSLAELP